MKKLCFVVMGYGKKTDYSSGAPRTLDLDKTYENLIEPAVCANDLECIRSDKLAQSGIIDIKMYEMLLRADVVVADISTANPNALYELGVRHALRPFSTIMIKEVDGKFLFDLNHLATLQYKHLGDDIGASEAREKTAALTDLIAKVLQNPGPDSPVYTYLNGLQQPKMSSQELERVTEQAQAQSTELKRALEAGRAAASNSNHAEARDQFNRAYQLQIGSGGFQADPFVVQQLALHTYKAKQPDAVAALRRALTVINILNPEISADPETTGIAGAIQKRLFEALKDKDALDQAVELYGRGFEIKHDYYNGENYAVCLDLRSDLQADPVEKQYDALTARKVRQRAIASLRLAFQDATTSERSDYMWMQATMANLLTALGEDGSAHEKAFLDLKPPPPAWAVV